MKIVLVMTYYDRQFQLNKTLNSIEKSNYKNFEVVIVDDGSPQPVKVESQKFPVTILTRSENQWKCSSAAYNTGIYYAMLQKPEILIIQNAECYHVGDVIQRASEIHEDEYLTFGCYSIDKDSTFNDSLIINNKCASHDGENAWYNHPVYRPVYYHFCSAISAKNMKALNGFEERLMEGIGYEDDNFLARIKMLGLKIGITTNPFVVHQWHYTNEIENKAQLVQKNKILNSEILKHNNPRAEHLMTIDL